MARLWLDAAVEAVAEEEGEAAAAEAAEAEAAEELAALELQARYLVITPRGGGTLPIYHPWGGRRGRSLTPKSTLPTLLVLRVRVILRIYSLDSPYLRYSLGVAGT